MLDPIRYGTVSRATLFSLLSEEARNGCHADLCCYLGIRHKIDEMRRRLGDVYFDSVLETACQTACALPAQPGTPAQPPPALPPVDPIPPAIACPLTVPSDFTGTLDIIPETE